MSKCETTTVTCPACNHEQDFVVWSSVNSTLDPELKDKLLSWELVDFQCKRCGERERVSYPLLYHDMRKPMMIWLWPGESPPEDEIDAMPGLVSRMQESYQFRWVQTYNELCEKIRLADAGMDDRQFEVFKDILRHQSSDQLQDDDEVFFSGISEGQDDRRIVLAVLTQKGCGETIVPLDVYGQLCKQMTSELDSLFPSTTRWRPVCRQRDSPR